MKPIVRYKRARAASGFTLIELMVAITILAVVAILSWRGLDQVMRGREAISQAMEDERVFAQLFDQLRIDARQAATDDEVGQPAVAVHGSTLQIVRYFTRPDEAPRLQVVRYLISDGRVIRYASPLINNVGQLRRTLNGEDITDWSAVPLMGGVGAISARMYIPRVGWTTNMQEIEGQILRDDAKLRVPQLGGGPLPRAVTGLEVRIGATSLHAPITRVFLVGE